MPLLRAAEVRAVPVLGRIEAFERDEGYPRSLGPHEHAVPEKVIPARLQFRGEIGCENEEDLVHRVCELCLPFVLAEKDRLMRDRVPHPERADIFVERIAT